MFEDSCDMQPESVVLRCSARATQDERFMYFPRYTLLQEHRYNKRFSKPIVIFYGDATSCDVCLFSITYLIISEFEGTFHRLMVHAIIF